MSHVEQTSSEKQPQQALQALLALPPEERERAWYQTMYQGDSMPQLTIRAVVMGSLLGMFMSLSNLYVGLKTGWGLGVAITSCILSYAIWTTLLKMGIVKTQMSILENNCMQSTASSAGYSTGGTMVSAVAAFLVITGNNMPFWTLFWWTASLALLGVCMAVPMKRQMINREQLKFPSGIAAAETLRSLHAAGGVAMKKAKALFSCIGIGAVIKWFVEGNAGIMNYLGFPALAKIAIPAEWGLPFMLRGKTAHEGFGLALPIDPMMVAAGAIVGLRTSISMAIGAIGLFWFIGPWLVDNHILEEMAKLGAIANGEVSPMNIRKWGLWTGSSMMVTAGLTAFAFQWKSILAAFSGLAGLFGGAKKEEKDPLAEIEVPNSWFAIGTVIASIGCITIMQTQWGIDWYWGIISIMFAFVLSLVACRATGETDITPIGAMGKVTQLFYGMTIPQNATANLMTAGVTAGAAGSAADLLTDLKSGYILGANPRKQFIAQALGIIGGTLIIVPVWYLLIPSADVIGSAQFPAPAAQVWASVSRLLSQGLSSLHPTIVMGMIVGGLLGILLTILEQVLPKHISRFLPSATGIGLAFVINFSDSMAFLIGALIAWGFEKYNKDKAEIYTVAISSGIIAGESLMGIAIALLGAAGFMG